MRISEACSQEQFELIHAQLEKTRRSSDTVKVDRQALQNLLIDHAQLHAAVASVA